jgi:response regulator of citrate/malate metabolism
MKDYCIILIEDDLKLKEAYERYFIDNVKVFRDVFSFNTSVLTNTLLANLNTDLPIVLIIDIMLANNLDPNALKAVPAPRNLGAGLAFDPNNYIDYTLGLEIGKQIRNGVYAPLINKDTAILYITARRNDAIIAEMNQMTKTDFIIKPFAFDEIEEKIKKLL